MSDRVPAPPQRPRRPHPANGMKRKRPVDDGTGGREPGRKPNGVGESNSSVKPGQAMAERKRKRPKKEKANKAAVNDRDADLDYDLGLNRAFARMDNYLLANHLARQTSRFGSDLSAVELADLSIPSSVILDTSSYTKDRTLENLPDFLEAFCPNGRAHLASAPSANGSPHTIVVTGAGLRAADLVRSLRPFQSATNTVAKLFAKHIKLAEAVLFLQSHRTGIAVGTPARLIDLLEQGALSVAHLQRLVVDASHIDQKKRGVLDMQDTALPVARWLARPEFLARYGSHDDGEDAPKQPLPEASGDGAKKPLSILFY